jgi:asparagine synthase (glutamine-hydrolysing)
MCGIAGVVRYDRPPEPGVVEMMLQRLVHRGPDGDGLWRDEHACLGHRRLSILDLSASAGQPMIDDSGRFVITFNGEIYNFRALRQELLACGEHFETTGDTEVLLKLFRRKGPSCLEQLNGMFAFAVWDRRAKTLFAARDRMGEKPFYYVNLPRGGIAFASEIEALQVHPDTSLELDPCSLGRYLSTGYTLDERTILAAVRRLPPACYLQLAAGRPPVIRQYWDLAAAFGRRYAGSQKQAEADLRDLLDDSTRLRLESDVPLGAFLSGGIDSAGVVDAMKQAIMPQNIRAYTIGFRERSYSEIDEAVESARVLGVALQQREVYPNVLADLPQIFRHAGEPFADTSIIPTYYLARFAREEVTVALSGDGGDELFGGYETYVADRLHGFLSHLPRPMLSAIARIAETVLPVTRNKVSLDYKIRQFVNNAHLDFRRAHWSWRMMFDEAGRRQILTPEWAELAAQEDGFDVVNRRFDEVADAHPIDQAMYVDMKTWLPDAILVKVDRATMASSLESRAPYLDHRLVEFAASLPIEWKLKRFNKKYILKRALAARLPEALLKRKKRGFNAPVSHWMVGPLKSILMDVVSSRAGREVINVSGAERLLAEHVEGIADHGFRLFNLLSLGLWLNRIQDARLAPRAAAPAGVLENTDHLRS